MATIKVKVLGSIQDGGLPHPLCHCQNCRKAIAEHSYRRYVASLSFFLSDKAFLIDATPDITYQLSLLEQKDLQGIFLTHVHIGHIIGLTFFGKEAASTTNLSLYCTESVKSFLAANKPFSYLLSRNNLAVTTITPPNSISIQNAKIRPFFVPHRNEDADTVGYRLVNNKTLLYIPDMDRITDQIQKRIANADIAIIDGTFYSPKELPQRKLSLISHPFVRETVTKLRDALPSTDIFFTHFNHSNPLNNSASTASKTITKRGFKVVKHGETFHI